MLSEYSKLLQKYINYQYYSGESYISLLFDIFSVNNVIYSYEEPNCTFDKYKEVTVIIIKKECYKFTQFYDKYLDKYYNLIMEYQGNTTYGFIPILQELEIMLNLKLEKR